MCTAVAGVPELVELCRSYPRDDPSPAAVGRLLMTPRKSRGTKVSRRWLASAASVCAHWILKDGGTLFPSPVPAQITMVL